jgi:integrase
VYLRAKTEPELDDLVRRTKYEIDRGELCFNSNTKFCKWAEEWLETYKRGNVSQKNYDTYRANLRLHINPVLGNLPLCDIRKIHCQSVLNRQAGKSKSHVGKLRMTMFQVFEEAEENGYISKNPARRLDLPKVAEGTHRPITAFERQKILVLCKTHRAGLWVLVMLYCGLRPSEAIALNWSDIDFKHGFINVARSLDNDGTKTEAGARRVPLPLDLLEKLRAARRESLTAFIFGQMRDPLKPHTETSMRCMWENFKRELDISMGAKVYRNAITRSVVADDLTPYCLRHTCATDYQAAGVPLNIAKVLLGHKDVQVTANVYTHYSAADESATSIQLRTFWGGCANNVPKRKYRIKKTGIQGVQ